MKAFIGDVFLREACYNCEYKGFDRNTDLTLGDCWGAWNTVPEMDDNCGTSLVLINSNLGNEMFQCIKSKMKTLALVEEDYLPYNPSILTVSQKPSIYNEFHNRLKEGEDTNELISEYMKIPQKRPLNKGIFLIITKLSRIKNQLTRIPLLLRSNK